MEGEKIKINQTSEAEQNQDETLDLSLHDKEYIHEAVSSLREPIVEMLNPILANIENGKYQLLIGDDASGRIPALIVRTVVNGIYAKNGHPNIQTRFIAGTRGYSPYEQVFIEKKEKVAQYIQDLNTSIPNLQKALIVTDTIASGKSLIPVAHSLRESGIAYDILTVGDEIADSWNRELLEDILLKGPIFSGQNETPLIYDETSLSGVEKDPKDLHATAIRNDFPPEDSVYEQKKIALAREEAKRLL